MEEWKEYKYTDLCLLIGGGTPKTTEESYWNGNIPWLSVKDFGTDRKYVYTTEKSITQQGLDNSSTKLLQKDDIIISARGTIGAMAMIVYPMAFNQSCFGIRGNDLVNKDYLFYLTKTKIKELQKNSHGSVFETITRDTFSKLDCFIPPLSEQNKIASVLKSLDDKIEVNRRINENLEQQAQALFKSWFVDFEPFKDQPFVESELGMIPQGWRAGRYEEIIDSTISGDWGKEKNEGNYTHKVACIRGCDFQEIKNGLRGKTPERYILEKNYQTKHFKDKDILVEISGGTATVSTGRVCPVSQLLIDKYNKDIVCTNFCRLVRPKALYGAYLYYSWLYKYNNKVMFGYENGTSGIKNFRIKDFISLEPVIIPSEEILIRFQTYIDQLQIKLQMNGSEIQKLAELRDTLLPRLMSGELKVNDLENNEI